MKKKPRLIIHIGTHKTGSTSLQKTMRDARAELLQAGVLYPMALRGHISFKHALLLEAVKTPDEALIGRYCEALLTEFTASGAHTMILSEERLWRNRTTFNSLLKRLRGVFKIEIVAYLRRPDLYMESLYNQMLRSSSKGEQRTADDFWRDTEVFGRLSYHRILSLWRQEADAVTALDFSREVKAHGLTESFFRAIKLKPPALAAEQEANKSPDGQAVLTLRTLRESGARHDALVLLHAAETLDAGASPAKYLLGSVERAALLAACHDDDLALQRDFGVHFASDMPKEGEATTSQPQTDYLLALVARLSSLVGDLDLQAVRNARREIREGSPEALDAQAKEQAKIAKKELRLRRRQRAEILAGGAEPASTAD
jgi:hypothetical protein